jgi:hypothetical protein
MKLTVGPGGRRERVRPPIGMHDPRRRWRGSTDGRMSRDDRATIPNANRGIRTQVREPSVGRVSLYFFDGGTGGALEWTRFLNLGGTSDVAYADLGR